MIKSYIKKISSYGKMSSIEASHNILKSLTSVTTSSTNLIIATAKIKPREIPLYYLPFLRGQKPRELVNLKGTQKHHTCIKFTETAVNQTNTSSSNISREAKRYPESGFSQAGKGEPVIGVYGELGIDEEENSLLDGVQSGAGSTTRSRRFHFDQAFRININAEEYVFAG